MSIITRYIIKEQIGPFFLGLSTLIFVFILNIIFKDLGRFLGKGLTITVILEFFIYSMAWVAALAFPMSVLVSTLMSFGRLSADNEITAFKASGVHLYRLIVPILILATILAVGMERFNNVVLPDFNHRLRLLYSDISRKKPTLTLEPHVFFNDIPNYSLLVHEIDEKHDLLKGIIINDTNDPKFTRTIIAETGTLEFSTEKEMMVFTLFDGEIHEVESDDYEQYRRLKFDKQVFSIAVNNMVLTRSESENRGDREKSASMMWENIREDREAIQDRKDKLFTDVCKDMENVFLPGILEANSDSARAVYKNTKKAYSLSADDRADLLIKKIEGEQRVIQRYNRSINSLLVEIHKKYSIPVACIVFVLIGAPLGIMARQGGLATGWGFSILFFFIYWTFLIGGEQLADRQIINPIVAMWLPNGIVGLFGIYLVIRTVHEVTYLSQLAKPSVSKLFKRSSKSL